MRRCGRWVLSWAVMLPDVVSRERREARMPVGVRCRWWIFIIQKTMKILKKTLFFKILNEILASF